MKLRAVFGFHAVNARLKHATATVETLYVSSRRQDRRMRDLLERAQSSSVHVIEVDDVRLDALAGGAAHQGVVALCSGEARVVLMEDLLADVGPATLLLVLDGVTDPRNLGACMRTAAVTDVASKAAAGAAETLPFIAVTNLARAMGDMKEAGIWIAGATGDATQTIFELDLRGPLAWALGAEGSGLRRLTRERCDWLARIPMAGSVESLNVAVATGVCLFETVRQRTVGAA
jgi:23S rRNA (guanosine2251-2'-O)-methyltransferase